MIEVLYYFKVKKINFDYGQSQDFQKTNPWLRRVNKQQQKRAINEIFTRLLYTYSQTSFFIISIIIFILSFANDSFSPQNNLKNIIISLTIFVVYILPHLVELLLRGLSLFLQNKRRQSNLQQHTNIHYQKFKKFKRDEYHDYKSLKSQSIDSVQNIGDVKVTQNLEDCIYSQIERGDFILLQRNQQAPGDMLLLDMSDNYGLFYSQAYTKVSQLEKKLSIKTTHVDIDAPIKGDLNYLRRILKGKIQFDPLYEYESFNGTIKLSKDPKGESITPANILFQGQVLQFNDWILGVILSMGDQTAFQRNIDSIQRKGGKTVFNKYFIIKLLLYIIVPIIISVIQFYGYGKFVTLNDQLLISFTQFLIIYPSYSNLFILFFEMYIEFLNLIKSSKLYATLNTDKTQYQIYQPTKLFPLITTTHVFLNVQIITETQIDTICMGESIYNIDVNSMPPLIVGENFPQSIFTQNLCKIANEQQTYQVVENRMMPLKSPLKLSINSHVNGTDRQKNKIRLVPNLTKPTGSVNQSLDSATFYQRQDHQLNSIHSQELDEDSGIKQIIILREQNLIDIANVEQFRYFQLFTVMCLCHFTRSELVFEDKQASLKNSRNMLSDRNQNFTSTVDKKVKNKYKILQYFLAEDEAILKISKLFKFQFRTQGINKKEMLCYVIKANDLELTYVINYRIFHQGNIDDNSERKGKHYKIPTRFVALVIQDNNFQIDSTIQPILLCRFCIVQVSDIPGHEKFDQTRKSLYEKQIQYLLNKGDLICCYIKLELREDTYFNSDHLIINDYEETQRILEILNEQTFEVVSLVGIAQNDIQDLQKDSFLTNRQRIIVSSDKPHELLLPFCIKNGIINNDMVTFNFNSKEKEDILYQIRQIISGLQGQDVEFKRSSTATVGRKSMISIGSQSKQQQNVLMMDGIVLNNILNDSKLFIKLLLEFLANHFGFIIHFNKYLIVYNVTNSIKSKLINFFQEFDQDYSKSISINYGQGSYGLNLQADISMQRFSNDFVDVLSYNNDNTLRVEDIEVFDFIIVKKYFQYYQIIDGVKRLLAKWGLTIFLITMWLYVFPDQLPAFIYSNKLYVFQIILPVFALFITYKTITLEQEFLKIKINTIKFRMINIQNDKLKDFLIEAFLDSLIILLIRYIIYNQQLEIYQQSPELYSSIYLICLLILMLQLCNQTKIYYLKFIFILMTFLFMLVIITLEFIQFDADNLIGIYTNVIIVLSFILGVFLKIVISQLLQQDAFIFKNFLKRYVYDLEFHIILESISKNVNNSKQIQKLIKGLFSDFETLDVSLRQLFNKSEKNTNQIQISNLSLNFLQEGYQNQFINMYHHKWEFIGTITNINYLLFLDIYVLILFLINFNIINTVYEALVIIFTFLQFVMAFQSKIQGLRDRLITVGIMQTILRTFCCISLVAQDSITYDSFVVVFLLQMTISQQINYRFDIILYQQLLILIIGILIIFLTKTSELSQSEISLCTLLYCYGSIINLNSRYYDDLTQREDFVCHKQLDQERQKYQQVMSLLLPQFVLGRVDDGQVNFSENQGEVGILFVDICQFEKIVSEENQNIVALMDKIYRSFDQICSSTNCQKIETVGKTYMACAGLQVVEKYQSKTNKNPIERLIELAFGILQEILNFRWGGNKQFILKIGIHYGTVLMGVIGSIKPQFSLVGDTVNTTSRLCSLCGENRIQISKNAYKQVSGIKQIKFTPNQIEAKGLGLLDTYYVDKKRNQESFIYRQKKSPDEKIIDKKIRSVLEQGKQTSFRNPKAPMLSKQSVSNFSSKLIRPVIIGGGAQETKNEFVQMQNPFSSTNKDNVQGINSFKQVSSKFIANRMNIRRLGTKRNVNQQTIVIQNQNQIQKDQVSNRFIHQKSIFSHLRQDAQQQEPTFSEIQQQKQLLNQFPSQQQQFSNQNSPFIDMNQEQSISILEQSKQDGFTPLNYKQKKNEEYKLNQRLIKFGDVELAIKINPGFVNKTIPLIKVQEAFQDKKMTINDQDKLEFNLQFIKDALSPNDNVNQYYEEQLQDSQFSVTKSLLALLIMNLFFILFSTIDQVIVQRAVVRTLLSIWIILQIWIIKSRFFEWSRGKFVILIGIQLIFECVTFGVFYDKQVGDGLVLSLETIIVSYFLFSHQWLFFQEKIIISVFMFLTWLITMSSLSTLNYWQFTFVIIAYIMLLQRELLSFLFSYKQMIHSQQIEMKQDEKMNLLRCLLPIHVLTKFLDDKTEIQQSFSDTYDNCTILFADIAGFTKYSSSVQPEEVVNMLKNLFDEFDRRAQNTDVFKLYTIGDCYVVIGVTDNLKREYPQEAFNVVEMGIQMLEVIELVRKQINYYDLHMRIGIHTGNVIGGIIGTDIIRYDVYGKDILIANKMESSSEEGRILISETTKKIIDDHFDKFYTYSEKKVVEIKSINTTVIGHFLDI